MRSAVPVPSLIWFARHELRLAWRDWTALMAGGHRLRDRSIAVGSLVFAACLHGIAYALLSPLFAHGTQLDPGHLALLSALLVLAFTMMLSQAMESVTRAFYSRDDLDLLLSSPAQSRDLFIVRIVMICLSTALMAGLMIAPFINVAAWLGGARWLSAYGVVLAIAAATTGLSVLVTLALFRGLGPKRTRLVSQIAAAVVGASFLIGIQVVAIVSYGSMSRFSVLNPATLATYAPAADSLLWLPALAASGSASALAVVLMASFAILAFSAHVGATAFRRIVINALAIAEDTIQQRHHRRGFRAMSAHGALMWKEWMLLGRDPWLISQTLMQVLYLIPPALMLWVKFGEDVSIAVLLAPVIVMATGQLAGGLAWLTISGEDAPDLIATAPVSRAARTGSKVTAVLVIIAALVTPISLALAMISAWGGFVTFVGALVAASCAILIQLWFGAEAKRSNFRRRQVASKASTFCEAFASILCAATASLGAAGNILMIVPAVLAALTMAIAWGLRPRHG